MDYHYLLGLLTIPILAIACIIIWLLFGYARVVWAKLDHVMIQRVVLRKNLTGWGGKPDPKPYSDAIGTITKALEEAPRLTSISGFGWMLFAVRNSKSTDE